MDSKTGPWILCELCLDGSDAESMAFDIYMSPRYQGGNLAHLWLILKILFDRAQNVLVLEVKASSMVLNPNSPSTHDVKGYIVEVSGSGSMNMGYWTRRGRHYRRILSEE